MADLLANVLGNLYLCHNDYTYFSLRFELVGYDCYDHLGTTI